MKVKIAVVVQLILTMKEYIHRVMRIPMSVRMQLKVVNVEDVMSANENV
jgi:hypothetical protein